MIEGITIALMAIATVAAMLATSKWSYDAGYSAGYEQGKLIGMYQGYDIGKREAMEQISEPLSAPAPQTGGEE